jgi:hypothetical protein
MLKRSSSHEPAYGAAVAHLDARSTKGRERLLMLVCLLAAAAPAFRADTPAGIAQHRHVA